MTKIRNKKSIYVSMAVITLVVAIGLSASSMSNTAAISDASSAANTPTKVVIENTFGAEDFLAKGGKAAISIGIAPTKLTLERGGSADVAVTITYMAGNQPHNSVDISVSPEKSTLTPPSIASITTTEQRVAAINSNNLLTGMIPLGAFESFSENRLTLYPGESKTITMHINIPQGLPAELVGTEIHFYPSIQVSPQESTLVTGESDLTVTISK